MPETPLDITRTWVEFADPGEDGYGRDAHVPESVIRADLTWLTSSWTCIFGRGCPGVWNGRPDDGCCTLGAHFSEPDDERRVAKWVKRLDESTWQRKHLAKKSAGGWVELDDEGERKTRVVDGACIFCNDPDFPGGGGCALHNLAVTQGVSFVESKPDVCWQLPVRRTYETITRGDGSEYLQTTITEYDRRGWGPGGLDMDWYCSGNTEAHIGAVPVFVGCETELRELIGDRAYEELARLCREAMPGRSPIRLAIHPATASAAAESHDD